MSGGPHNDKRHTPLPPEGAPSIAGELLPPAERHLAPSNSFEAMVSRISEIKTLSITPYGDIEIPFGGVKAISITTQQRHEIGEVVVSLRRFPGGLAGLESAIAVRRDESLERIHSINSNRTPIDDDREFGLAILAHTEGLVLGAALMYGEIGEASFSTRSSEHAHRRGSAAHSAPLQHALEIARVHLCSPDLTHPGHLEVQTIEPHEADSTHPPGVEFKLSVGSLVSRNPLLSLHLDSSSPVVEVESKIHAGMNVSLQFDTTSAAAFFIVGICNGALAAESAQRYNSTTQRILRKLGFH
ncbi:MAG: hypothetical protein RL417_2115 [Pseudomonadota bacterium]